MSWNDLGAIHVKRVCCERHEKHRTHALTFLMLSTGGEWAAQVHIMPLHIGVCKACRKRRDTPTWRCACWTCYGAALSTTTLVMHEMVGLIASDWNNTAAANRIAALAATTSRHNCCRHTCCISAGPLSQQTGQNGAMQLLHHVTNPSCFTSVGAISALCC
jgi:hypothetical protein